MLRVGTFNVENLDDESDDNNPPLKERIPVLRSDLNRLDADILCLQEVHSQKQIESNSEDSGRILDALDSLLEGTKYATFNRVYTKRKNNRPYAERNLVILSSFPIVNSRQYLNNFIDTLQYRKVTAIPPDDAASEVTWERPILYAEIDHPQLSTLHVIDLHLKSRLASNVKGQKEDRFTWNSAAGWAEGYFLSSIKRVGQALETRILIDDIFDGDENAKILVCGDFNAEPGEVPVKAICGKVENVNNPKLRSRVLISCSKAIAKSVRYTHLYLGNPNLLDHILISQSLLPCFNSARAFNENLHDESLPFAFDTKYPESDHAAFLATFTV